jgi:hypothetical protein
MNCISEFASLLCQTVWSPAEAPVMPSAEESDSHVRRALESMQEELVHTQASICDHLAHCSTTVDEGSTQLPYICVRLGHAYKSLSLLAQKLDYAIQLSELDPGATQSLIQEQPRAWVCIYQATESS